VEPIAIPRLPSLVLAVIQPSPFCNIDCQYCYLPERGSTKRMDEETLRHLGRFLFERPDRVHPGFTILWHGGEPTAVPVSFYERAFAILDSAAAGTQYRNRFSTNATLLDDRWCELIARWRVAVRVSIDGPQWLHDIKRVDRSGRGTFDRVMRGIEALHAHDIPFDVISTISDVSLDHAQDMWRFYRSIGASALHFCVEEVLGAHTVNSLGCRDAYARLQRFFATLMELRDAEAPGFYIRELDELIEAIPKLQDGGSVSREEAVPLRVVSVAWDGGISTFSPELLVARNVRHGDFIFGNVATHSAEDLWYTEKLRRVHSEIRRGIRACRTSCPHFAICGGGCPAAKVFETGSFESTETLSCRLRIKAIGDVVLARLSSPLVAQEARRLESAAVR
jgi:uncharacterized protein